MQETAASYLSDPVYSEERDIIISGSPPVAFRERERERERQTDRQTDRDRDRETETDRNRQRQR